MKSLPLKKSSLPGIKSDPDVDATLCMFLNQILSSFLIQAIKKQCQLTDLHNAFPYRYAYEERGVENVNQVTAVFAQYLTDLQDDSEIFSNLGLCAPTAKNPGENRHYWNATSDCLQTVWF